MFKIEEECLDGLRTTNLKKYKSGIMQTKLKDAPSVSSLIRGIP